MYQLEKPIWDDSDFEVVGWHDATVWSILPNPTEYEFLLDLDYIFKWVAPEDGVSYFKFWVSPVTMVFQNAYDLQIDISSSPGSIEIADLHRDKPELLPHNNLSVRTYRFECQEGEISIKASGFRMFVRRNPALLDTQSLSLQQRSGVSFLRRLEL